MEMGPGEANLASVDIGIFALLRGYGIPHLKGDRDAFLRCWRYLLIHRVCTRVHTGVRLLLTVCDIFIMTRKIILRFSNITACGEKQTKLILAVLFFASTQYGG